MKRKVSLVLAVFLIISGITFSGSASAATGWTWTQFTYNNDIWMRTAYNGTDMFDYRLGAGGCLAEMRYCPSSYKALLSPTYAGEETDRVVQYTFWGTGSNVTDTTTSAADGRFNVDLAGTMNNTFAPTISVARDSSKVDVYSVPQNQWYSVLDSKFTGIVSSLSRYEMLADGVLKVRKVVRVPAVYHNGTNVGSYDLYFEQWNPFLRNTSTFDCMALSLDTNGVPNWWYQAGNNIPSYPNTDVASTNGYAAVYKYGAYATSPVVGIVFGKSPAVLNATAATSAQHKFNSMDWNNGIGVFPSMYLYAAEPNSIIDYTYYIVPRQYSDASFKTKLDSLASSVPAPQIYGPNYTFSGELATIASTLRSNLNASGTRTNHLAQFAP